MTAAEPLKIKPLWVIWHWFFLIFTSWGFFKVLHSQSAVTWYFCPVVWNRWYPKGHSISGQKTVYLREVWEVLHVTDDIVIQYYTFCSFWFQKTHITKLLRLRLVLDLFLAIWTFPGLPTDSTENLEIQKMLQSLIIFSKILKVIGHSFAGPVFIIHLYAFKCFPNLTGFQRTFQPFSILTNEYRRGISLLQINMM